MRLFRTVARSAARYANIAACIALLLVTVHILADTIATKFFDSPFNITHTAVTRYYMVSLVFLALANVELRGDHIKADLFYSVLSPRMKRFATGLNLFILAAFTSVLTWQLLVKAIAQTGRGEKRTVAGQVYLYWPSRWIAVAGMLAFALVAVLKLIDFLTGDQTDEDPKMETGHD